MATGAQKIQQLAAEVRHLARESASARPELEQIEKILQSWSRTTTGGVGTPSNIPVTKQDLILLDQVLSKLEQVSRYYKVYAADVAQALTSIGRVRQRSAQAGIGIGRDVTRLSRDPDTGITGRYSGTTEQLRSLTDSPQKQLAAMRALRTAQEELSTRFGAMGAEFNLKDISLELDGVTKSMRVSGEAVKTLGEGAQVVYKEFVEVGLAGENIGKILTQNAPQQMLASSLGEARFKEFSAELDKMGFSMNDLTKAEKDAITNTSKFTFVSKDATNAVTKATFRFDKFGNTISDASNRFKTFTQAIASNMTKVIQWGISTSVIFGAMRAASEIIRNLAEIESAIANVAMTADTDMATIWRSFEKVSDAASYAGVSTVDAMTSMAGAMQAAEGADEAERMANALILTGDAAIFASISGMDMAQSTDVLVSVMKQMNDESITNADLLDKWVAVSTAAKVSLKDFGIG